MKLTSALLLAVLTVSAASAQDVRTSPKEVETDSAGVRASGRWVETGTPLLPSLVTRTNTVTLTCDRASMQCTEAIAMLSGPEDGLAGQPGRLSSILFQHTVTEWTDRALVAQSETRASDIAIVIDLALGIVLRSSRETSARGGLVTGRPRTTKWRLD